MKPKVLNLEESGFNDNESNMAIREAVISLFPFGSLKDLTRSPYSEASPILLSSDLRGDQPAGKEPNHQASSLHD
jgi:hypothetical protein